MLKKNSQKMLGVILAVSLVTSIFCGFCFCHKNCVFVTNSNKQAANKSKQIKTNESYRQYAEID